MRFEAEALEFPWVEELPKREKSRLAKAWDCLKAFSDATKEAGALVPVSFAASILGVSDQRIRDLVNGNILEGIRLQGHLFISERSIVAWARTERKAGRPPKALEGNLQIWKASHAAAKQILAKK